MKGRNEYRLKEFQESAREFLKLVPIKATVPDDVYREAFDRVYCAAIMLKGNTYGTVMHPRGKYRIKWAGHTRTESVAVLVECSKTHREYWFHPDMLVPLFDVNAVVSRPDLDDMTAFDAIVTRAKDHAAAYPTFDFERFVAQLGGKKDSWIKSVRNRPIAFINRGLRFDRGAARLLRDE